MSPDRFWPKVNKTEACWYWIGARDGGNYGIFWSSREQRDIKAHRWAYENLIGPIPDGLVIDHLCRVRLCVNPAHLEPVTQRENLRRGTPARPGGYFAVKTHCPHGHPYDEANTVIVSGVRRCRTCIRRYAANYAPRRSRR